MAEKKPMSEAVAMAMIDQLVARGPALAKNALIRERVISAVDKWMLDSLKKSRENSKYPPGVNDDRVAMSLAIDNAARRLLTEYHVSEATIREFSEVLIKYLFLNHSKSKSSDEFREKYGIRPPTFLTLSPGKGCNLHCTGCYADSGPNPDRLDWSISDRIIREAKEEWGAHFIVLSGGEPLAYHSEGKDILDLVENHPDCFFMMYTNGTLITDEVAKRISNLGNLIPAISVEGWRERTDARRGPGMFDKIETAMHRLFDYGVPMGISMTGTRQNCEEILSDEFIDHFFFENHAIFGWIFQYMPIGRSYALELMPTPEQRLKMWRRSLEIIREKKIFLADFWNHGSLCEGCLSAGGSDAGGYLYIDWNGTVSPCVFVPYSPVNIKDVYARGGTLTDAWKEPFFEDIRKWQFSYKQKNMMAPCINRDHHEVLDHLIAKHEPTPSDENARQAMLDPEYSRMLETYSAEFQRMADEVWKIYYTREPVKGDGKFGDLPDLSTILQKN